MSHVVTIKTQVKDAKAMTAAFQRLGGTISEAETYKWYGEHVGDYPLPEGWTKDDLEWLGQCHYKVSFPGCRYEVGVIDVSKTPADHPSRRTRKDGEFEIIYDFVNGALSKVMGGETANKFTQAYKLEKTKLEVKKKHGNRRKITEQASADGTYIELIIE